MYPIISSTSVGSIYKKARKFNSLQFIERNKKKIKREGPSPTEDIVEEKIDSMMKFLQDMNKDSELRNIPF